MNGRRLHVLALALGVAGCASGAPPGSAAPAAAPEVRVWGALHRMVMENDRSASVSLADLTPDSTLYALGAAAGLDGEITVAGGDVWRATPGEGDTATTVVSRTSDAQAALLVAAHVTQWRSIPIEAPIPFDSLDARIAALAEAAGLDTRTAFPFLIEGPLADLHWHVVDGRRIPPGVTSHAAHREASVQRVRERATARLLGFYSTAHEGVFTHRGARTHVHAMLADVPASGHVDHVVIEPGATFRVPAR